MGDRRDPLVFERLEPIDGLEVVRQPAPAGARSFAATFVGPSGWAYDPSGAEGTARLGSHLATSGAGPYDRVALARLLDRAGATLSAQCAPESGELTVWGPVEEEARLVAVLADAVLHPRFDTDDVRRGLRQMHERQMREATQPSSRADRELLRAAFPSGHPYRSTGLGTERSIRRIDRPRLRRFHAERTVRDQGLVVLTTPTAARRVRRLVARHFVGFPRERAPGLRIPTVSAPTQRSVRVTLPGTSQVEIRIGGTSLTREDPDYPAAFLANETLGGRPLLARLFQSVRERAGLAYHASSELEAMRYGGYWAAQAGTAPKNSDRTVRLLRNEVRRLAEETIPPGELRTVRESAIGEIELSLETTADAHELAVDAAYHRLPEDHWRTWPAVLRAISPRQVRDAAARAFATERSVTVVTGPVRA